MAKKSYFTPEVGVPTWLLRDQKFDKNATKRLKKLDVQPVGTAGRTAKGTKRSTQMK